MRASLDPGRGDSTYTHAANVEELSGGGGSDTLIGSEGADQIDGGEGADTILAMGGDDRIVTGSAGGSYVDAGGGSDHVSAGGVGDQVELRDGARDFLDCPAFADRRVVERDRVDGVYCSGFAFLRGARHVRVSARGVLPVALACPPAAMCRGTLRLSWRGGTIATRSFDRAPNSRFSLRFKLARQIRRALARSRYIRVVTALKVRLHPEPAAAPAAARRIAVMRSR